MKTMSDVGEVEKRVELVKASDIPVEATIGGVIIQTVAELAKLADTLARGGVAVPPHCRNQGGTCFALCLQAREWGFPIMSVINKSYVVNDRIGYESQLIHAVVEQNAPIKNRLRYEIVGTGDERRCKVWATFNGEDKPHEYISEPLAKLRENRPQKRDGSGPGGSALWDTNPEVQMFYSASRQWARLYCPDVILGAYTPDELQAELVDVTPNVANLTQRLQDARLSHTEQRGFDQEHVNKIVEGQVEVVPDTPETVAAKAKQAKAVMSKAAETVKGKRK